MAAMWCWPHELGHPEILIRRPGASARSGSSRSIIPLSARAMPRDEGIPSWQVAAPGHGVTARREGGVHQGQRVDGDPAQDEVLLVARPRPAVAELARHAGDGPELRGRRVAADQAG